MTINLVDISGEPTSVTFTGAKEIRDVEDIPDSDPDDDGTRSITSGTRTMTLRPWEVGRSKFPVGRGSEMSG